MASIKDVARLAGVSVGTVSNVLNRPEQVSPERRALVERAIAELSFVRNEPARQLRAGVSRTIAVVVLDIANPFFTDLVKGAEEAAEQHDAQVIVCNSNGDPEREARHLRLMEQQRVLGILLSPVNEDLSTQLLATQRRQAPVVFVDRVTTAPPYASVAVNDIHGGSLVGELLAATGHERVAFLGGPLSLRQVNDRLYGLRSAGRGLRVDVHETSDMSTRGGAEGLARVLAGPPDSRPTALFCANDLLAIGAINECVHRGIAVPDELSVVGYDDISFASTASVPLTTVAQPRQQLGRTAVELLLGMAGDEPSAELPQHIVFEPELVIRSSTRAAPQ
ncbi:LacI family DNA-binding transcriptional regulator [Streptomyces sp. NPDC090442]|uniref:LacI family DNA-binding transcriptional regulator n=1 Tax=Streptomyces sp. NPDC090442 TaxID=3365962 RepID=UPI00380B1AB6